MKKHLIAAAVSAAIAAPVLAQNLVISGGLQVGIMNANTAATSTTGVAHLGNGANAINIRSTEDLGGGLTAGYDGQIRFNAATGDINSNHGGGNALFHNSNFFLSSKAMGTLRVGRIAEESNCAFDPWGCGGGAALAGGIGLSSSGAATDQNQGISMLAGAGSQSNSVRVESITWNGLRLSYQQSVTGPLEATRSLERRVINLTYAQGPISAQVMQINNGANTTGQSTSTATGSGASDTRSDSTFGGLRYNLGFATVGYSKTTTKNTQGVRTASVDALSVVAPLSGPWTLLAGWARDGEQVAERDTKTAAGVNYRLSKRTTLGADLFQAETATGSVGFVLRAAHTF